MLFASFSVLFHSCKEVDSKSKEIPFSELKTSFKEHYSKKQFVYADNVLTLIEKRAPGSNFAVSARKALDKSLNNSLLNENERSNRKLYEIIKSEDLSRKATGNRKLRYQVVISSEIRDSELNEMTSSCIHEIISKDNEIDEIILQIYSDKELINGPFDIGSAIWAPFGKLGNVDSKIAQSNSRKNYRTSTHFKENVSEYLRKRSVPTTKLGFSEEQRRNIFKDLVKVEDRANSYEMQEQDKVFDSGVSREVLIKKYDKIARIAAQLKAKYIQEVYNRHGINEEIDKKITSEGLDEGWTLD